MPSTTGSRSTCASRYRAGVSPEHAAFATVGAIAMQGVRRAEVQLGERPASSGLAWSASLSSGCWWRPGCVSSAWTSIEDRCRLAEKAGALACAAPTDDGMAAVAAARSLRSTEGRGADHVLLAAGGSSNGPVEHRRQAGAGPRPSRRHRQDPARSAVERLLRQGARRPLLPVLRARPLRRPLRARGDRLPDWLRALDRAAQPRLLPGPARAQDIEVELARVRRSSVERTRQPSTSELASGALNGGRFPVRVPARGHACRQARRCSRARPAAPGTAAPRDRRAQLAVGFIGAGNYASSMLLPHLARLDERPARPRGDDRSLSAVNAQRRFGFTSCLDHADAVLDDDVARRGLHRHPPSLARRSRLPRPADRQGRLRREAARADQCRGASSASWTRS